MKKLFTEYWQEFDVQYIKKYVWSRASAALFCHLLELESGFWKCGRDGCNICYGKNNPGGSGYFSDGL